MDPQWPMRLRLCMGSDVSLSASFSRRQKRYNHNLILLIQILMTRKRTSLEIYLELLTAIRSGVHRPTNIMYRCNLAWKPFKGFLNSLIEHGLVRAVQDGKRRAYELTEKGHNVLEHFEMTQALLATLGGEEKSD